MRHISDVVAMILVAVIAASAAEKNEEFQVTTVRHSLTTDVYSEPPSAPKAGPDCKMTPTAVCVGVREKIARYDFWQEVKAGDGMLYRLHRTEWAWSSDRLIQDGSIVLARISGDKMYLTVVDRWTGKRETLKFTILQIIPPTHKTE